MTRIYAITTENAHLGYYVGGDADKALDAFAADAGVDFADAHTPRDAFAATLYGWDHVDTLRAEAGTHGDADMVAVCDRYLDTGSAADADAIAEALSFAQAQR